MFAIWGIWIERNQECKLLRFMSVALIWDMVFICAPISDICRNWGAVLGGGHVGLLIVTFGGLLVHF